ncbi:hypothetical protein TTHERM_001388157 (macronuclear) [Tetrahymena thermophila SB210]|uniref:Uncharacterized protein n=1 Tax=Tetrahymena thermophila (strain SB210) TaxID=312017 RepID=W7WYI5_TETTS|nr:hypothetical protein TTHERM_001388157 [Tetrahymena thermophila SB210]EWS71930.1 hypothetical protein TTHERM_001388157 [Tetrahymena thermophila SB210]|eukprot:XP_012655531.1 hypothetical protein TTHERM_001388157 [Tetrahymena thermophila SB210]
MRIEQEPNKITNQWLFCLTKNLLIQKSYVFNLLHKWKKGAETSLKYLLFPKQAILSLANRFLDQKYILRIFIEKMQAKINNFIYFNQLFKINAKSDKIFERFQQNSFKMFFLSSFLHAQILKKAFL